MTPLPDITAALIDMDGTLYDSMPRHAQAWERLAREEGWSYAPGEFYLYEGMTGAATIAMMTRRTFGRDPHPGEADRLYARKTRYFRTLPAACPMPGAARMLAILMERGITRVLVTGSGQSSLLDRLDTDFPGAFGRAMRITALDVVNGKPSPEPFERAMALAGAAPGQSLVIENAPLGVQSGHRSGAFTIAANTGPIDPQVLADSGADIVFPSMEALADALPALLPQQGGENRGL